jgi:hypothetical protein
MPITDATPRHPLAAEHQRRRLEADHAEPL